MDATNLENAVKTVKTEAEKAAKKFTQSVDLVIVTKSRRSKGDEPVDAVVFLPNQTRDIKTCAFVDKDMSTQANGVFSVLILKDDLQKYDKKSIRKLIKQTDFFFAEASIMAPVAAKFGKQLTAANKMPNPKTNTIITPASNLQVQLGKVKTAVKMSTKKNNAILVKVGDQKMDDAKIIGNINAVYSSLKSHLSDGENSIKHVYLKSTMGKKVAI